MITHTQNSRSDHAREFSGKSALITGGTKGLGLSTALLFAKRGADVYLTYRSDESSAQKAYETIKNLSVNCEVIQCDLSEDCGIQQLFNQLTQHTTQLDFYIHNAAATAFKNLSDLQPHHIDKTMNITVKSFILGVNSAAKMMKPGSAIVSVSGMDTEKAVPKHGLLGAAKAALETLTAYYAHELAMKGIQVNSVNPGFFESESTRKYLGPTFDFVQRKFLEVSPMKRAASLEDIAHVILFLCSPSANWIVGQTLKVDGGFDFALPLNLS